MDAGAARRQLGNKPAESEVGYSAMKTNRLFRRLPLLLVLAGPLLVPSAARAQNEPAADAVPFTLKPLGHNVYAAIAKPKGQAGSNSGFVIGENSVLVVDTFVQEGAAKALLAEIRKLTALPVKYVVNTHYHLDHVAGNKVYQDAGATVIAHRNVAGWIHTENLKFFGTAIKPEQKSMVEALGTPDLSYGDEVVLALGETRVRVQYFPGHTGGDSVVSIPAANVIFMGDLFWNTTLPNLIDASTDAWVRTLSELVTPERPQTYVPGHGDVGEAKELTAFRGYLNDLRAIVGEQVRAKKGGDELVAGAMPALKEKYGQWNFFDYFAKRNVLDTAAELRGEKKIPQPKAAAL
jgi:cyclase